MTTELDRYYLDGPGETLIVALDFDPATPVADKIFCVVTSKSATLRNGITMDNVTGGKSPFPRRRFLTEAAPQFELEDCEMDFRYISITSGEDIIEGALTAWAFGEDYKFKITGGSVTLPSTPVAGTLIVQFEDGTLLTSTASTPVSTSGNYHLEGINLTFAPADEGKVIKTIYQYQTTGKTVSRLTTSVPKAVKIIHRMPMYDDDNTIKGIQEIEIFKAQPGGDFEQAFQERAAYAPRITFDILDDKRWDKKIIDQKFIPKS